MTTKTHAVSKNGNNKKNKKDAGDKTRHQTRLDETIASNIGITSPMLVSTPTLGREAMFISFGRDET